jgi:hypothetical protein
MCSKGAVKRIIPFIVTLTIGLFIASFFVDLAPRPFAFADGRRRRSHDFQQMYLQEHDRAERLQQELDRINQNPTHLIHNEPWNAPDAYVPPPPTMPMRRAPGR